MVIHNDVEKFILFNPVYYRYLKSFFFKRNISSDVCGPYDVDIVMVKISENNVEELRLRFTGAFGVNLGNVNGMLGLQIEIRDVSSSQIEGARFKIVEAEGDAFSFYCKEFFAEVIQ